MSAGRRTVVVHGATGVQGAPVAARLLAGGHRVRAVGRRPSDGRLPAGAEPVAAGLEDADALAAAYAGADAVVVVLPGPAAPDAVAVAQAEAVLAALSRAAVPRAVLNTSGAVWDEPVGVPFLDARTRLATGLAGAVRAATVLVPAGRYLENLEEPWVLRRLHAVGVLAQPGPAGAPVPWVALDDLADAVAALIAEADPPGRVTLTGPPATGAETAAALAAVLGRAVAYEELSSADHLREVAAHLGAQYAAGLAALYAPDARVPPPPAPPAGGRVARGPTGVADWAAQRAWARRAGAASSRR